MSYIGVKINGLIKKMAGMPLMDVAFSNRSTNGVQNKVIKAKFDEIDSALWQYVGSATDGNNVANIPSAGQLLVIVENSTTNERFSEIVDREGMTSATRIHIGYYHTSTDNAYINIVANPDAFHIGTYEFGGDNVRSTATIKVYARSL